MLKKVMLVLLFITVAFTLGTTWIAMKIIVSTIPPIFATGMRFLLVSPLLIGLSIFNKAPFLFPKEQRLFQLIITLFYFSIPFSLMLYGGIYVNAGLAALIFSMMPVMVLVMSIIFLKETVKDVQIIGLFISIISFFTVLFYEILYGKKNSIYGIIAIIISLISHSIVYVQCKKNYSHLSVLTFNTIPSLLTGVLLTIVSFFYEKPIIHNFSYSSMLALWYLANFSGFFGVLSYFYLQTQVSAFFSSIIFVIFPIIALIIEYYMYNILFSTQELYLIVTLVLGIVLIFIPKNIIRNRKINFI
ncbi:DMT family transporter [Buchnera aphidicola]|uniref:DMT family transporter n=1 Tax=Buchnera aphidicola (Anoecia oenotherae) TaxID=1241833 RepID=A0A4D6XRD1_9GAMM|nr:DMT family transporter [Buchnera aphidicola]QCI19346.1 DMT family transporter [Buchnera aphidicola (Anoecia oenotherae)]